MRLGIVSDEVHEDIASAARWAREWGITRMELRSLFGARVPDITGQQLAEVRAVLTGEGMTVSGLSPGIYKSSLEEADPASQVERLKSTMEMAAYLGTGKIICFGIRMPGDPGARCPDRARELLADLSRIAGQEGFTVCFENEPGYYNGLPEQILELQRLVYPLGGRLNWDPGNLFMAGVRDMAGSYQQLRPYIGSIHMKDYTTDGVCVPLGEGCLGWQEQIECFVRDDLRLNGEPVDMNLETHCRPLMASAQRSYSFVRGFWPR